jgi:hypothetical protein
MSKQDENDPLATFHLGPVREGRMTSSTPNVQNLKAPAPDVDVPEFVKEAVARLETPEQARLLLKMLRTFGSLGTRMSKERLDGLVDGILAREKDPALPLVPNPGLAPPRCCRVCGGHVGAQDPFDVCNICDGIGKLR